MSQILHAPKGHYAKIYRYPCGIIDIVASSSPDFVPEGWEAAEDYGKPERRKPKLPLERDKDGASAEDLERSMRRARAKVRRLALANDFKWFVTLTLDAAKINRFDAAEVVKKLGQWCDNQVRRRGLRYVLVPERHQDGALHFHGFFNDALEAVDSGTLKVPGSKKPRKPRSKAQRAEWLAAGGQIVYNLPGWTLGFTTAIQVHGEYPAAVAYVCKYIGKQGEKPAGRWYYSGGDLAKPLVTYADIDAAELQREYGGRVWSTYVPGRTIAVLNGLKEDTV